jgi:hypothetical protein
MIESVVIRNFQKHGLLRLRLGRVTTLAGPSDAGKSAVLRALLWCLGNTPGGKAFVKKGKKTCQVTVKLDGRKLLRRRGKKANLYRLGQDAYKALGQGGVPAAVRALANVDCGPGSVNVQRQHDGPFWLADAAGEVARSLNDVCDLGRMDACVAAAAGVVRSAKAQRDAAASRAAEAAAGLASLEWLAVAAAALARAEALEESLRQARRREAAVAGLLSEREGLLRPGHRPAPDLSAASALAARLVSLNARAEEIATVLGEAEALRAERCRLSASLANCERQLALVKSCPLCRRPFPKSKDKPRPES